ncbi:hypothetical protein ACKC9G_13860 [Pokkaliibacter sp. CJK22405]|uniref:hypothetical protein n=1 Tax=Pokkaliibacter sp. CJK22405 TaxID=3384615 RepID=UPI0039854D68
MKTSTLLTCCALFSLSGSVSAEPPTAHFDRILDTRLEATNFAAIQQEWGEAPVMESGQGGEKVYAFCYQLEGETQLTLLSGEMGGDDHQLLGYQLTAQGKEKCANPAKPIVASDVLVPGLSLGMTQEAFADYFGDVSWNKGQPYHYYEWERPLSEQELSGLPPSFRDLVKSGEHSGKADVGLSVSGHFIETAGSKSMNQITVWQVSTY